MNTMVGSFVLKDINGETVNSDFLKGMTYVMNFIPELSEDSFELLHGFDLIYQKLLIRNVIVFAVVPDIKKEDKDKLEEFDTKVKILIDSMDLFNSLNIKEKTTFLIGRDGNVIEKIAVTNPSEISTILYDKIKSLQK